MKRISGLKFSYLNNIVKMDKFLPFDVASGKYRFKSGISFVGYCEGECLGFRPKDDCYGLMVQEGGEEFWLHVSKEQFRELQNFSKKHLTSFRP